MKRLLSVLLLTIMIFCLSSCRAEPSAEDMLNSFLSVYSIEGTVYTPSKKEGEAGYISQELLEKMFVSNGALPPDFAIYLNPYPAYGNECGVFVCKSAEQTERVADMCRERLSVVSRSEDTRLIIKSGRTVFYSCFSDPERAERIWEGVLRDHT